MTVGTLQDCTRIVISSTHQVQTARELKAVKRKDKEKTPLNAHSPQGGAMCQYILMLEALRRQKSVEE
jgi:hypothetical protein